jgi:hypothetical protein
VTTRGHHGLLMATAAPAASLDSAILADSPWAYWRLRETGTLTTAADFSGNARTGTYSGAIAPGSAIISGNTGSVEVTGGRVALPAFSLPTTDPMTLEMFIQTTQTGTRTLFGFDASGQRRFTLRQVGAEVQFVIIAPSTVTLTTTAATINNGSPHHVVCVWDPALAAGSGRAKIYVDDVLLVQSTAAWTISDVTSLVGALFTREGGTFQEPWVSGFASNAAIYLSALTAGQISAHYAARNSL